MQIPFPKTVFPVGFPLCRTPALAAARFHAAQTLERREPAPTLFAKRLAPTGCSVVKVRQLVSPSIMHPVLRHLTLLAVASHLNCAALAQTPPDESPNTKFVGADQLNVRTGPSTGYESLTKVSRGTEVTVVRKNTNPRGERWYEVRFTSNGDPTRGWVSGDYLLDEKGEVSPSEYASLNYDPVPKPSYPGNPRIDAKGVYVSIYTAASGRLDDLLELARTTEINAMVIDVKDDLGRMLYRSEAAAEFNPTANDGNTIRDPAALLKRLKDEGIYTIARVVTFKDPAFSKAHPDKAILNNRTGRPFESTDGLRWASPYNDYFQRYNIAVAREAAALGFNEIQFDYVRFPAVSRSANLNYRTTSSDSKAKVIQDFLLRARGEIAPLEVYIAADVFGLVGTARDDMNLGQYWEAVSNAVDYICPMMYPSHYANGSYGLRVPDKEPFALIDRGVRDALARNRNLETPGEIRPWIQAFTATWLKEHRTYDAPTVREQIRALEKNGVGTYLVWSPGNRYNAAAHR